MFRYLSVIIRVLFLGSTLAYEQLPDDDTSVSNKHFVHLLVKCNRKTTNHICTFAFL